VQLAVIVARPKNQSARPRNPLLVIAFTTHLARRTSRPCRSRRAPSRSRSVTARARSSSLAGSVTSSTTAVADAREPDAESESSRGGRSCSPNRPRALPAVLQLVSLQFLSMSLFLPKVRMP